MKFYYLLGLLLLNAQVYAQTIVLEGEALNTLITSQVKSQAENVQLVKDWQSFMKENTYPELPVDANGNVFYSEVVKLENVKKQLIFKKVKEWLALTYGNIEKVLHYEDIERGKIIAKGFFKTSVKMDVRKFFGGTKEGNGNFDVYHTLVFTIKDGKLKMDLSNLEYKFETNYLDGTAFNYKLNSSDLYPVVVTPKNKWKMSLNLMDDTNKNMTSFAEKVKIYILDDDQSF